jgi:uncharacterized OB-fold protein
MPVTSQPFRPLPILSPGTAPYWQSGADGLLRIQRCPRCGHYTHPPGPVCARCLEPGVEFVPVSGRGTVYTCTANHHPWFPGWTTPYCIAIVQLDEQDDVRLFTNVVNCDAEAVRIGDRVRVLFEHREDVWLPLFEPDGGN